MEAMLSFPFAWRMFRWSDRAAALQNRRLLCESYLVTGQRDVVGLKPELPLQLRHSYDKTTGIHRFALYQKRRLVGYLPLPEAQKLAENKISGHRLFARISWYAPEAPFWEKIKVRISAS